MRYLLEIKYRSEQFRSFLECLEDNFLTQLVSEAARGGAHLSLNRERVVGDVMAKDHLGHWDNELIVFDSQRSKESQQTHHLGFQKDRLADWLGESLGRQS